MTLSPGALSLTDDQAALRIAVGSAGANVESLTLWLEAPDSEPLPTPIHRLAHVPTRERAQELYKTGVWFALAGPTAAGYHLWLVIPSVQLGPPPGSIAQFCENTRGSTDKVVIIARKLANCPP